MSQTITVSANRGKARGKAGEEQRSNCGRLLIQEFELNREGTGEPPKNFKQGRDMDRSIFEQTTLAISERIIWEGEE